MTPEATKRFNRWSAIGILALIVYVPVSFLMMGLDPMVVASVMPLVIAMSLVGYISVAWGVGVLTWGSALFGLTIAFALAIEPVVEIWWLDGPVRAAGWTRNGILTAVIVFVVVRTRRATHAA